MDFSCTQCGAKYTIRDGEVRGKAFKVRCKRCNAVAIGCFADDHAEDRLFAKLKEPFLREIELAAGDARSALVFSQISEAREILSERGLAGVEAHVAALAARDLMIHGDCDNADAVIERYALDGAKIAGEAAGACLAQGKGDGAAQIQSRYDLQATSQNNELDEKLSTAMEAIAERERDQVLAQLQAKEDRRFIEIVKGGDCGAAQGRLDRMANARDASGQTVLMHAAAQGHLDMARLLIARGAKVDASRSDKTTALHLAAARGQGPLVEELSKAGADLDAADSQGRTPLICAARAGDKEAVAKLVEAGAKVSKTDPDGAPALMVAAALGLTDVAEALLRAGADLDHQDATGMTALARACFHGRTEMAAFLLEEGAHVEGGDRGGMTPLIAATLNGEPDTIKALVLRGADVNGANKDGVTPLIAAAMYGRKEATALLIDGGANAHGQASGGWTALMCASEKGHKEVAALLESHSGVALHEANAELVQEPAEALDLALIEASKRGDVSSVQALLRDGARVAGKNKYGWTALMEAESEGHKEVVALLKGAGA